MVLVPPNEHIKNKGTVNIIIYFGVFVKGVSGDLGLLKKVQNIRSPVIIVIPSVRVSEGNFPARF